MHYLAHSITALLNCATVGSRGMKAGRAFQCVGICLYAKEWMCLDCLRFDVR